VLLVDKSGHNLLFRSNDPLNSDSTEFLYDLLISYFKQRASEEGVVFPE